MGQGNPPLKSTQQKPAASTPTKPFISNLWPPVDNTTTNPVIDSYDEEIKAMEEVRKIVTHSTKDDASHVAPLPNGLPHKPSAAPKSSKLPTR